LAKQEIKIKNQFFLRTLVFNCSGDKVTINSPDELEKSRLSKNPLSQLARLQLMQQFQASLLIFPVSNLDQNDWCIGEK
jgi:hypothetical protein